jgi:hypothetical protein
MGCAKIAFSGPRFRAKSDIKICNRFSENMAKFKYLGTRVTNQNFIQK